MKILSSTSMVFVYKQNALAPLRTLQSLDSISAFTLNTTPSILTSTQLPAPATTTVSNLYTTTLTFAQILNDLTQNDIRKTIIEDLQRSTQVIIDKMLLNG